PSGQSACPPLPLGLGRGNRFREYSEVRIADRPVNPTDIADHIIVQDPHYIPAFFLGMGRQALASIQPLFLPGKPYIYDATFKIVFGKYPGRLEGPRHSTGIVICSRGIRTEIRGVTYPGIDVPAHDDMAVGISAAPLHGHHIDNPDIVNDPGVVAFLDKISLIEHLQTVV